MAENLRMDIKNTQRAAHLTCTVLSTKVCSLNRTNSLLFSFDLVQIRMSRPTHSKEDSLFGSKQTGASVVL